MSVRSFRSVGWVAGIAATALGCYMVNLKVASERAALEDVETRIVLAERDIRLLQTEIGTRGRLAQLEKWNVRVLALSAPAANQFMEGSFQLATLVAPKKIIDPAAPVVLASAPAPAPKPVLVDDGAVAPPPAAAGRSPAELMHVASLKREVRSAEPGTDTAVRPATRPKPSDKPAKVASAKKAGESKLVEAEAKAIKPKESSAKPAAAKPLPAKSAAPKAASSKAPAGTKALPVSARVAYAKLSTTPAKPAPKEAKAKQ